MPHAPPYKQSLVLSVDPNFRDDRYFCCVSFTTPIQIFEIFMNPVLD